MCSPATGMLCLNTLVATLPTITNFSSGCRTNSKASTARARFLLGASEPTYSKYLLPLRPRGVSTEVYAPRSSEQATPSGTTEMTSAGSRKISANSCWENRETVASCAVRLSSRVSVRWRSGMADRSFPACGKPDSS